MFYRLPHPWDPGFALPDYVRAEPPGRGVFVTAYTPRKTIQSLIPQYLGDDVTPGSTDDPIAQFGHEVSAYVMRTVYELPPSVRKTALRALFNQLDPLLWSRVAKKAQVLESTRDMGPMEAMEKAIAASASTGLMKEIVKIGRTRSAPPMKSMIGLAAYGEPATQVVLSGFDDEMQALGICGPICMAKKAGGAVKGAAKGVYRGAGWAAGKGWSAP